MTREDIDLDELREALRERTPVGLRPLDTAIQMAALAASPAEARRLIREYRLARRLGGAEDPDTATPAVSSGRATRPGPDPATSREAVTQMKARLKAEGLPYGERPVAKALGVSRGAVRYAMGKDRH